METHLRIDLLTGEAALAFLPNLIPLAVAIFDDDDDFMTLPADAAEKPGLMLLTAWIGTDLRGFKMGYRRSEKHFYSWLGGVLPEARGHGIARRLMDAQHAWATEQGYTTVSTETFNRYRPMLLLNIQSGFDVVGTLTTLGGEAKIVLRKVLGSSGA
ncbi:GNAT family N-acetyltransferase [Deinococcus sp. KNUC1210]|uniref:GNAT family N-acetyltransferase n=1 Tax=Deinococcus sp. KNUC1210 TaxID=2917691 RepID=UPI001EEF7FA9|nr:GNAT family N-acetyltransferase [Deinococcus sp. KNUC1210]ULH15606.1 GNAT family N-acetyltransferase [Deinococcus sp. KNUC1210]